MRMRTWSAACGVLFLAAATTAAAGEDEGMGGPPAAAPAPAPGQDVLVLKDGTEVRGRITAEDEAGYAVKVGGALRVVEKSAVSEVRRGAPAPEADPPADPKTDGGKVRKKDREAAPMPLTEDGQAWARTCIERLQGADPAVQRSAAEALRALGPPVLPVLRKAMEGADDAAKQRLERVAGTIGKSPEPMKRDKGPAPVRPAAGGVLERVKADLALDEAQSKTVGAALLSMGRDARTVREDARDGLITYEEARTKVAELRGKLREGLKATLTEEQLRKLDGILDEMSGGPGKGPPPKKDR